MRKWIKKINYAIVLPFSGLVYIIIFGMAFCVSRLARAFKNNKKNPISYWNEIKAPEGENNYESTY